MHRRFRSALFLVLSILFIPAIQAYDPVNGDFTRADADHVRVLHWNVEHNLMSDLAKTNGPLSRVVGRVDPDIISFNELYTFTVASMEDFLETATGASWEVHTGIAGGPIRNVLCARVDSRTQGFNTVTTPLITDTTPASEVRGVTGGLIECGDTDFYVMSVHFKAFSGQTEGERRQTAVDAIINWQRDARTAGENIDLPADTPMLVVGDMNFVGGSTLTPDVSIVSGDISDEVTYGADSPPDWDATDSLDVMPQDPTNGDPDTWDSAASSPTSRLDRFIVTDSVINVENSFILNTDTLSGSALIAAAPNLLSTDCVSAADHLPVVVDFSFPSAFGVPASSDILINEIVVTPTASEYVELVNLTGTPFDLEGCVLTANSVSYTVNAGVTLPANGYVALTQSNTSAGSAFLSNTGATLSFANSDESIIFDAIGYGTAGPVPAPIFDESAARVPDATDTGDQGNDWNLDDSPTSGAANDGAAAALGSSLVTLNEIYHNTSTPTTGFIELHNASGVTVDLTGWQIIGNDDYDIPGGQSIPAGGHWLLLEADYPAFMSLTSSGDNVYLLNASAERVDQVGWTSAGATGDSLSTINDGIRVVYDAYDDSTNAIDWGPHAPTPGGTVPAELSIFTVE